MRQDEVQIGQLVRVIAPRWDRQPGTLGRVTETGHHALGGQWWFTVGWLTKIGVKYPGSLRLGVEDLRTFELVPESEARSTDREDPRSTPPPMIPQIPLPFTGNLSDE